MACTPLLQLTGSPRYLPVDTVRLLTVLQTARQPERVTIMAAEGPLLANYPTQPSEQTVGSTIVIM